MIIIHKYWAHHFFIMTWLCSHTLPGIRVVKLDLSILAWNYQKVSWVAPWNMVDPFCTYIINFHSKIKLNFRLLTFYTHNVNAFLRSKSSKMRCRIIPFNLMNFTNEEMKYRYLVSWQVYFQTLMILEQTKFCVIFLMIDTWSSLIFICLLH